MAPEQKQPNILVIWGDDIGITNLSCYSDGLMGYRTPNIDRIAKEGMRFTDPYGEQSCTVRDRPVRQEPPGRPQQVSADRSRLRRVLRQPLPPERRGGTGIARLPVGEGFPALPRALRSARCHPFVGDRHGRYHRGAPMGPGGQTEDRGHGSAHQEADGDLRRRVHRGGQGLDKAAARGGQALLLLAEHDPHAPSHPYEAGKPRAGRPVAVAIPRHHDRPRQECRRDAGPAG